MTLIPPIWRESTNSVDCYCGGSTNFNTRLTIAMKFSNFCLVLRTLSVGRDDNDDSPVLQYSSVYVKPMEENAVTLIQLVRWPFWAPDEISERLGTVPLYWGGVIAGRRCPTGLNWVIIISSKCCCDLFRNLVFNIQKASFGSRQHWYMICVIKLICEEFWWPVLYKRCKLNKIVEEGMINQYLLLVLIYLIIFNV